MTKPKRCPGTFNGADGRCVYCAQRQACGLRSVVARTFAHSRREEVVAP